MAKSSERRVWWRRSRSGYVIILIRLLVKLMKLPGLFYYGLSALKRELGPRIELFGRTKQTNHITGTIIQTTSNNY